MKHWFLDTNVLIDFLLGRLPFALDAAALLELARRQQLQLYAASLSFATAYYITRKTKTHEQTLAALSKLTRLVQVVSVDATTVQQALAAGFPDFEDALQYFAATAAPAITAIITRDPQGFRDATVLVLTPAEAVAQAITGS
ncbi:PIN domain-containing protein [Hymenobacter cellulosivorans]|uniref:PIN domain-containing protein n=1 Tax=Hymenobacter cellulosivorans TaxID=2932249 RepID=A0ABY4FH10_9BACT|nr:PIN domain-containing protein [Hymenobacter cellulosivorans]UOQ55259.1 PIN domain-containing protein [Hymenobacter cellulosivorans]